MTRPFAPTNGAGDVPVPAPMLVYNNPMFATPPTSEPSGFLTTPTNAWAPGDLQPSTISVPDSRRLGIAPNKQHGPDDRQAPDDFWEGSRGPGRDTMRRHDASEIIDADGMRMFRPQGYAAPPADDPRRTPAPENRPTQLLNPHRYFYTRPFGQHSAKELNGSHFSMADHRRVYADRAIAPFSARRNTYRLDPGPWDLDQTDYPENAPEDWGGYNSGPLPATRSRSGRLD